MNPSRYGKILVGCSIVLLLLTSVSGHAVERNMHEPPSHHSQDRILNLGIEYTPTDVSLQDEQKQYLQTHTVDCMSLSERSFCLGGSKTYGGMIGKDYFDSTEKGSDYFYMDFNPSSDPHTINGGRFEGESWTCTGVVTQDDFDDTPNHPSGWASLPGIYSAVRTDQDLNDGTSQMGAWCSCAMETGGVWNDEDSRGYATVSKSFNLGDFVDMSLPNFAFTYVELYCDYKIYSNDFNHGNSYVYFEIYISDTGGNTWPIAYEYFTGAGDAPAETEGGYCIDVWDPSYTHPMHPMSNPNYLYDDYTNDRITISTNGQGGQTCAYLYDLFNNYGNSYTLTLKIFVRLYGSWGGGTERYQYWIDHVRLKCYYEYFYPDLQVTDIWIEPSTFYHGEYVTIKGTVKNTGDGDVTDPFYVDMEFDGSYIGSVYIGSQYLPLSPGSEITVVKNNFQWPNNCNPHTVKIIADADNDVVESNENNNWREESFTAGNHAPNQPSLTGPTSGYHGEEYTYYTSTTDPDGDKVQYWFEWGDGENSGWTSLYNSGEAACASHSWNQPGSYGIKTKAKDEFGAESGWSTVLYTSMANRAPDTPSNPYPENYNDWTSINEDLSWECSDPDGDSLQYDVYFGMVNPPPLDKENHQSTSYNPGTLQEDTTYYWQINAKDNWDETLGPIWCFTTREYNAPELSNYDGWPNGVNKEWGTCADLFTFKVHYYDSDGDGPDEQSLVVDGKSYDMQGSGSDADYTIELTGSAFGGGYHQYHFWYTDGTHSPGARLPTSYEWGFTVNYPPNMPDVSGPSSASKDEPVTISAVAIDNDGEDVQYYFEWGDGTNSGWCPSQPLSSGSPFSLDHIYSNRGAYEIKVKARDINGDEGSWGTLELVVTKTTIQQQQHAIPLVYQLLHHIQN